MPHIRTVSDEEATGPLKQFFKAAVERAGRVWNVVRLMSINFPAMRASIQVYQALMFGPSPLSRAQREMIAVTVSRTNDCYY